MQHSGLPFGGLPLVLIQHVVAFAVDDTTTKLRTLARVSRAWRQDIQSLVTAQALREFSFRIWRDSRERGPERQAFVDLRNELTLRRGHLRVLTIHEDSACVGWSGVWNQVLAAAPLVDTLHMHCTRFLLYLDDLLPAAARFCPRVRTLWIDIRDGRNRPSTEVPGHLIAALRTVREALALWNNKHGGIRELQMEIPMMHMSDRVNLTPQYVQALADYCPNLEVLSLGGRREHVNRFHYEQWHISVETWEQFCASCTQLKAFDWSCVPFATVFFETFGRFPKPKLEILKLAQSVAWRWDVYHRQYDILNGGFGATASHHGAVFAACPALRDLSVVYPDERQGYPEKPGFCGDSLCKALATCCRLIERFKLSSLYNQTVGSFTDQAAGALATLPALMRVKLCSTHITGNGLFDLVMNSPRTKWTPQRNYDISIGHISDPWRFYDVALTFLRQLAAWAQDVEKRSGSSFSTSDRVLVRLRNGSDNAMGNSNDFQACVREMRSLVDIVKRERPLIRLRLVVKPRRKRGMDVEHVPEIGSIMELDVYTVSAVLPHKIAWGDLDDKWIDDVIAMRGYYDTADD